MSEHYYIRIRGKVQGPFESDKLRQLARRGQFSRMHEVSTDGAEWQPALARPELFPSAAVAPSVPDHDGHATGRGAAPATLGGAATGLGSRSADVTGAPEVWYYVQGGKEQGPVDFTALQEMFAARRLSPDTDVWRYGMPEWVPAHTVPGLFANALPLVLASSSSQAQGGEVGAGVVRVLVESRGWVIFIAITAFLYAVILLFGGILTIILGPRLPADTAGGLIQMVFSIVVAIGGWLLMRFAADVERVHRRQDEESLRTTLTTLHSFWTFIGIVLIVLMTLTCLVVIVFLAAAGSFG